jgi:glutamine transport system substrate-binding protein
MANKRTLAMSGVGWLLAVLLATIVVTGCGGGGTPSPAATAAVPATPASLGKVKVGVAPGWEPWEILDPKTNQLAGFDIDLMKVIAKEAKFEIEFVQVPFDKLLDGLGTDYQVAISALLVTDERAARVAFSNDYQKIGLVLVVPSSNRAVWGIADIAGKKAGAVAGSLAEAEIKKVDAKALVTFKDYDSMFADLAADNRTLDVIVCDYLDATTYMAKTPGVLKASSAFTGEKLAIAVDKSRPDVLAAVNTGLKSAQDNYLVKDIVTDWLAVPPDKRPQGFVLHAGR